MAHRLEFVREWNGAQWYNDSIATAPERTMAAIHSFTEPIVLLLGGRDKNLPWEDLAALVRQRVQHVVLFGEAAEKISAALDQAVRPASADPGAVAKICRKRSRQPPKWPAPAVSFCFHRAAPVLINSMISKNVERLFENGYRNFRKPSLPGQSPRRERRKRTSTGDLILIAAVIALCIFGLLMLYSASTDFSYLNYGSQTFMFNKQLIFLAGGILIAFLVSRMDYHLYRRFALPFMAVSHRPPGGRALDQGYAQWRHPDLLRRVGPAFGIGKAGHDPLPVSLALQQAGIPARHPVGPGAPGRHPGWDRRLDLS